MDRPANGTDVERERWKAEVRNTNGNGEIEVQGPGIGNGIGISMGTLIRAFHTLGSERRIGAVHF